MVVVMVVMVMMMMMVVMTAMKVMMTMMRMLELQVSLIGEVMEDPDPHLSRRIRLQIIYRSFCLDHDDRI